MLNIIHSSRGISIPATGLQSAISLPTEVSNLETRSFPQLKIVSCTLCPTRSCLRCSKFLHSGEVIKKLEAAEAVNLCIVDIDTSKFHSGVLIRTKETVEVLREQRRIFDNKAYQCEDHTDACHVLIIWNPDAPKIARMNCSATFKYWQSVAIAGIAAIRHWNYLRGAVLGDTVGLGKTWEVFGLLMHISDMTLSKKAFTYY